MITLLALFNLAAAHASDIAVYTDRSSIGLNESFTLSFIAQGRLNAEPDFSPLQQDFEIVGTSQSSNITIVNGRTESQTTWAVTVFPKRNGTLTVPSIRFGSAQSPELKVEVTADAATADKNQDIFIEVDAEPENPYVGAQTLVTIRLYRGINMSNENLSQLELDSNDVMLQAMGDGKNYETTLAGRRYRVHERQYALFPQTPGPLTIKPLRYSGARPVSSPRSLFDFDPFGSRSGQSVRLQSEPLTLQVKPIPAAMQASTWLPAARLKIEESWSGDPAQFKTGEPLTRKLKLTATGLMAEQLPELNLAEPDGFKQYPDQPALNNTTKGNTIVGTREVSIALMPTRAGEYTLPAIEIPWWNTKTQKPEIARLPARTLTVQTGANNPQALTQSERTEDIQTLPGGIENPGYFNFSAEPNVQPFWFWLSLLFGLGWIITLYMWWRQNRRSTSPAGKTEAPGPDAGQAEKALVKACMQNRADAAKNALLLWARAHWPQHPPQSLEAIAAHSRDAALATQLRLLSTCLYAPGAKTNWDGKALWQAFANFKTGAKPENRRNIDIELEPLHKI